jgi:hypothetical protein
MIDEEPFRRERDENLRHANRLSRTFVLLQEALQRYRAPSRPAARAPQDAGRAPEQKSTKQPPTHKAAPPRAPAAERPAAERPAVPAETGRTQNPQNNPAGIPVEPPPGAGDAERLLPAATASASTTPFCDHPGGSRKIRGITPCSALNCTPRRAHKNLRNNPMQCPELRPREGRTKSEE